MRRTAGFLLLFFLILFAFSDIIYAAQKEVYQKPTGVLLIGDPLYRMNDFYKIIEEKLNERFPRLIIGEVVQSKYRKYYWEVKGLLREPKLPTRDELLDFLKTTPYEQALVLVIDGPNSESRSTFLWYFTLTQSQSSLSVRALLVDTRNETMISDQEVAQKGPLTLHGDMSAKRGCFRLVMESIASKL